MVVVRAVRPPERFMLVQNVFDECRGFEYHLSRSASCSPTVERILALGTAFQLRKFMAALSGDTEKCVQTNKTNNTHQCLSNE